MNLSKQTTQTRPENLQEVKEWLARIGKNKTYIISPFTERIGDFNETETGVYICNLEESAESEFLALHDGTVDNLVDYLYILGAEKDWKETYTKPQTIEDGAGRDSRVEQCGSLVGAFAVDSSRV